MIRNLLLKLIFQRKVYQKNFYTTLKRYPQKGSYALDELSRTELISFIYNNLSNPNLKKINIFGLYASCALCDERSKDNEFCFICDSCEKDMRDDEPT